MIPSVITNNSTTNYTISGPGKIGGAASIVKTGQQHADAGGANDFTGPVTIAGGTVLVNNSSALGAGSATVVSPMAARWTSIGPAFSPTSTHRGFGRRRERPGRHCQQRLEPQQNAFHHVTLAGRTTLRTGERGNRQRRRWDIRRAEQPFDASPGHLAHRRPAYKFTKVGTELRRPRWHHGGSGLG